MDRELKVGEVARESGVSVRTLHSYEEIGLLTPARRTASGQLAELERHRDVLGPEAIEQAQRDWRELIAEVKAEMEKGSEPDAEPVLALARRWQALVEAFTQRDPAMTASLGEVWQHERPRFEREYGDAVPSAEMMAYIGRALAALE